MIQVSASSSPYFVGMWEGKISGGLLCTSGISGCDLAMIFVPGEIRDLAILTHFPPADAFAHIGRLEQLAYHVDGAQRMQGMLVSREKTETTSALIEAIGVLYSGIILRTFLYGGKLLSAGIDPVSRMYMVGEESIPFI